MGGAWAGSVALGLQAHAHHAVEDQCKEADQRVGADAIRQAMMDRCDLDVGFQDAEPALDVGEALVAGNGLGGREIGCIGQERELAIEELCLGDGVFVDAVAEPVCLQIGPEEPRQLGLGHGAGEPAVGAPVGGAAATGGLAIVLGVVFRDHLPGHGLQVADAAPPTVGLVCGAHGIMRHDQAVPGEGAFR